MPLLSVTNLDIYYGAVHALKGVTLRAEAGEIVTLIGANGAVPSTSPAPSSSSTAGSRAGWRDSADRSDRQSSVFASQASVSGLAFSATGMVTEFGKITGMLQEVETSATPLQENLDKNIRLGLDLRGGSYLLLEIQVQDAAKAEALFKASAANDRSFQPGLSADDLLDLVAIGTVADLAPMRFQFFDAKGGLAKTLFGSEPTAVDHEAVPTAIFANPNVATVGLSEERAREKFGAVDVYKASFRALKLTLGDKSERTFMKLVVDRASQKVVGAHMIGADDACVHNSVVGKREHLATPLSVGEVRDRRSQPEELGRGAVSSWNPLLGTWVGTPTGPNWIPLPTPDSKALKLEESGELPH